MQLNTENKVESFQGNLEQSKPKWRFILPWVKNETHVIKCGCSYCREDQRGFVFPKNKKWNSWRSFRWRNNKNQLRVIRWALPKIGRGVTYG